MKWLIFLIFFLKSVRSLDYSSIQSQLITDLVTNEDVPVFLNIKLCWKKAEVIEFMKSSKFQMQFINFADRLNVSIDDSTNKIWFVVDMNCADGVDFVKNVWFPRTVSFHSSRDCWYSFQVDEKYFARPYRWMLLNPSMDDLVEIKNRPLLIDNNIIFALEDTATRTEYLLEQCE